MTIPRQLGHKPAGFERQGPQPWACGKPPRRAKASRGDAFPRGSALKPATRCRERPHAALYGGCGLTASERLVRTDQGGADVDPDDGCAFGSAGTPMAATVPYAEGATIDGHAAVYGGW
nr:MAG TPA: hypothetical protein [Caudoviricetes sp.]